MSDEYDDRCDDEQREANIAREHSRGCMESFGVQYDPYNDDEDEEADSDE